MTAPTLIINNVSLAYGEEMIFSHINLTLSQGKWIALLGQSGIGKSSLLRMIAGLMTHKEQYQGSIEINNERPLHQQIAYMAQTDLLLPWLTVIDNAMLGTKLRSHSRAEQRVLRDKALSLLEKVGLSKAQQLYPEQLSGGMRQRVALVRTIMEDKAIVLIDEPFSALDAITRHKLQELAAVLLNDKTVLFITHDPIEALRLANEIYIMQGVPAGLKLVASLNSARPRELNDPEVIKLQSLLFDELTQAARGAA